MKRSFRAKATSMQGEIWNATTYFKYHQSNKPRSSNLPRRVMMKLGEQQKQLVVKVFHTQYTRKVLKR